MVLMLSFSRVTDFGGKCRCSETSFLGETEGVSQWGLVTSLLCFQDAKISLGPLSVGTSSLPASSVRPTREWFL